MRMGIHQRNKSCCFILGLLLFIILSLTIILEVYYQHGQCAVSGRYSKTNVELTHRVIDMLNNLSIPYWPDCQSLLNVLRNETYNVWDHDVDLSIEWPFSSSYRDLTLNHIKIFIEEIEKYSFTVDYEPKRKLLSLKPANVTATQQSHVDIWLWSRKYSANDSENKYVLELLDYSFKYQTRIIPHIYPLKSSTWLGRHITIPYASHTIALKEYGASYMKATVFRINCFHNLFNGRWI